MAQSKYPKPHTPNAKGSDGTLQALILHQHQVAVQKAQEELAQAQQQMQKVQQEHDATKKKKELDDKLHQETRKELEKYKSQYDPKHILEKKTVNRETMQRARLAKSTTKKAVSSAQKAAKSRKPTSRSTKKS